MIVMIDSNNRLYLVKRIPKSEQKLIYRNRKTGEIYTDLELIGEDVTPRYAESPQAPTQPDLSPAYMA